MPEAEEVITDAVRHATIYARALWRRHGKTEPGPPGVALRDVAQRLDLLITAAFDKRYPVRAAQPPAPTTLLTKVFKAGEGPRTRIALPSTDGANIWLPPFLPDVDSGRALQWYRVLALQQAMRAHRASAHGAPMPDQPMGRAVFIVLQAQAADQALAALLPGMRGPIEALRSTALIRRPALKAFPDYRRPLEQFLRSLLGSHLPDQAPDSMASIAELAATHTADIARRSPGLGSQQQLLLKDLWTGDLYPAQAHAGPTANASGSDDSGEDASRSRSARLSRAPDVRELRDDEEDDNDKQGAWMVQTSQPHEQAEDPIGMQRPTDRDAHTAAEEFADALSELPEARLVSTPERAKEVLLSEEILPTSASIKRDAGDIAAASLQYPEWDYRAGAYRAPGATVHLLPASAGPQDWVKRILDEHRSMLHVVRRRFEMLQPKRTRLHRQLDGEEIDLQAYIDCHADFTAGQPMAQNVYQTTRPARRDMAVVLLIDISGSTDAWVTGNRRIIDVEREALLLVSIALQGLAEPYAILGFSGEGPQHVIVRSIKSFDEIHDDSIAGRIAGLEPEHYTRTGAALRHATTVLMKQAARSRLLMLLSDGKPNDIDEYDGQYGVEDMRRAVTEAKLQGISPFCLTIDRHAASYLPAIFGAHHYALLPRPELLPAVLLEWMKRLITA